jgi:L-aspartate oxidase
MIKDAPVGKRSKAVLPGNPVPKPGNSTPTHSAKPAAKAPPKQLPAALTKIRDLMWRQVGILRNGKELAAAIEQLRGMELPKSEKAGRAEHELGNLHSLALLVVRSALAREESRGSHYRSDFPYRNDEDFGKHSAVERGKDVRFEA